MHTENSHALHNMHIKYCGNIKFSEHRLEKKKTTESHHVANKE